MSLFIWVLH